MNEISSIIRPDFIANLQVIVGDGGVLTGEQVSSRYPGYFMDQVRADAIVRPRSTDEVAQIMQLCNAVDQPVVVQGGMSGWVRATQTIPGDLVLSLENMNAIEEIDLVNRTVTVQAGVILQSLQEKLEEQGFDFALDLGGRGSCQVGGNAATNAGGLRVIRFGMMREQILGLEAVLADGRVVSSMNRMIKNNTGYDLKHLFIGSEGTLGVITRLVLRLRERPRSSNTALLCVNNFDQIARLLRYFDGALGGQLSAFEMIDQSFYTLNTQAGRHKPPLPHRYPFYIVLEILGSDTERDTQLFETVLTQAAEDSLFEDAVLARSERERADIWAIREDLEHVVREFSPFSAFDVSLPVSEMAGYMEEVKKRLHMQLPQARIAFLGHVGDGNLHVAVGSGDKAHHELVETCVYEPLRPMMGSVSAEHGIGLEKKKWLEISRSAVERDIMKQLKNLFDPRGILNPGKLL